MLLLTAFLLTLLIQIYFYTFIFGRYAFQGKGSRKIKEFSNDLSSNSNEAGPPGVSVVICAFNEAENLSPLLKGLSEQDYPNWEILFVDDGSLDDTAKVLEAFRQEFSSEERPVRLLRIPPSESTGKKNALTRGIEMATQEVILLTDADCRANSSEWISRMVSGMGEEISIILGYGAYQRIEGSWLNRLIRFETLLTAMQYFSFAVRGNPYMGVGRNLAYRKKLFERANGFESHMAVRSGDDDLFVSQMASEKNTGICDDSEAFTISRPENHFSTWIRQKRRHVTTASHYKMGHKLSLGAFYLSQIGFYALALVLLLLKTEPFAVIALILLRFSVFYFIINATAGKLKEKDLVALAPLYEISIIFMQLYVFVANTVSPPKQW